MTSQDHALQDLLVGFGWYMRRTADAAALARFYSEVVGLPLLRGAPPVYMFWAGGTHVFELKSDEAPMPARDVDPRTAPCSPVFAVRSLAATVDLLSSRGARLLEIDSARREAWFLDSDNQLLAMREQSPDFDPAPGFIPACGALPGDILGLAAVIRRYADPAAAHAFYSRVVGLSAIGERDDRLLLDLGTGVVLEIAAGGRAQPIPRDRCDVTNSVILRVASTAPVKQFLEGCGVNFVHHHIQWKRAHLCYFADLEGQLTGLEERYDPSSYPQGVEPYEEDLEAERRYRKRIG